MLREARSKVTTAGAPELLSPVVGAGKLIAVESDVCPYAATLSRALDVPVKRWPTRDRLGNHAIDTPHFAAHCAAVRSAVGGLQLVVNDGGVAEVLDRAGVPYRWLRDVVDGLSPTVASCRCSGEPSPLACCGAAGPLPRVHPADAERVGRRWLRDSNEAQMRVADSRCRAHLRACGGDVVDPLDELLATVGS
jgi:hypothetical protein